MADYLGSASETYIEIQEDGKQQPELPYCLPRSIARSCPPSTSNQLPPPLPSLASLRSQIVVVKSLLDTDTEEPKPTKELQILESILANRHTSGSERIGGYLTAMDRGIIDGADIRIEWIAMEPVWGPSLEELLTKGSQLPVVLCLHVFIEIYHATEWLHNVEPKGIIHNDLKNPGNVMFELHPQDKRRVPGLPNVLLIDFDRSEMRTNDPDNVDLDAIGLHVLLQKVFEYGKIVVSGEKKDRFSDWVARLETLHAEALSWDVIWERLGKEFVGLRDGVELDALGEIKGELEREIVSDDGVIKTFEKARAEEGKELWTRKRKRESQR